MCAQYLSLCLHRFIEHFYEKQNSYSFQLNAMHLNNNAIEIKNENENQWKFKMIMK